jgi:coproporphyrinogen III oxidase
MCDKDSIKDWFMELQDSICEQLEECDGAAYFHEDLWQHHSEGGGRTRLIEDGMIIEKGGVNFSAVGGEMPEKTAKSLDLPSAENFFATGVSIVMHPFNPFVPIIHMNVRYFELNSGLYWFGGGIDLTPHYVIDEDAVFFHSRLKAVCDKSNAEFYPKFKSWCDDYFFLQHRDETRGVGGIFFDRLNSESLSMSKEAIWEFVKGVGSEFAPIYTTLMQKNHQISYEPSHTDWQAIRRSRYVEFNLLYDKGTKFGLETKGRTESILMSMPPQAVWYYNYVPEPESQEAQTLAKLRKGLSWLIF